MLIQGSLRAEQPPLTHASNSGVRWHRDRGSGAGSAGRDGRAVQKFEHATASVAGGHQGCDRTKATALQLVAADTKKDVVEKVQTIAATLEKTKPLG